MANDTQRVGSSEHDDDHRHGQDTQPLERRNGRHRKGQSPADADPSDDEQQDFEHSFARWLSSIRRMLRSEFPSLREADVEDIQQEVRKALLERLAANPGILEEKGARSLALAIARNKATDVLRRREREKRKNEGRQNALGSQSSLWTKLTAVEQAEFISINLEIFDALPPFEQFLWNAYVEHYPRSCR